MGQDQNMRTVTKLLGVALIFMGFINNLLSITGNYELDPFTAVTFLTGVILFVMGTGNTWHRWIIAGLAAVLGVSFLIRGQVGGLSQVGLFWGTIFVIFFYGFFVKESKSDGDTPRKGAGTGD